MRTFLAALLVMVSTAMAQFDYTDLPFLAQSIVSSSSGFAPTPPHLWYRADDSNGMATGTIFNYVRDRTGNGNDSTNIAGNIGGTLTNNAINGRSAWEFMNNGWITKLSVAPLKNATSAEIFWVVKSLTDTPAAGQDSFARWLPMDTFTYHPYNITAGALLEGFFMNSFSAQYNFWPIPQQKTLTNWHIYSVKAQSNDYQMYINGHIVGGADRTTFRTDLTNIWFGQDGSGIFKGWIAEVMIYSNALSTNQRVQTYNYFSNFYGLTITNSEKVYTPLDFPNATCWGWWDANTLGGLVADRAKVSSWADLSGNNRAWTNADAATQPAFWSNIYNGRGALRFTNSITKMFINPDVAFTNRTTPPLETFMIIVNNLTNANSAMMGYEKGGNFQWRTCESLNTTLAYNGTTQLSSPHHVPVGTLRVNVLSFQTNYPTATGVIGQHWMNVSNTTASFANDNYRWDKIGAVITDAVPAGGEMCEIILMVGSFTKDDWAKMYFTYLKPKWGLP